MDRVAVFVDAGYLFAQGTQELLGEKVRRKDVKLDAAVVIDRLREFATGCSKLDLLRIYWYDGTATGPTSQHIALAELPDLKFRLGLINAYGEQKGVDSLIVTDMVALAGNRAMAACVLLAGDEDLRMGVLRVQEHGVRVHLLGIKPARGNQSDLLRREADATHEWKSSDLDEFLSIASSIPVDKPPQAVDSLEGVARDVAATISEEEVAELVDYISTTKSRPRDIDGHLLARGRDVVGQDLDPHQKRVVRAHFLEALKIRLSGAKN